MFILFLFIISCRQQKYTQSEFVLGTFCTVTLFENGNEKALSDVFARLREIDNLFSVNIPSSDISRINKKAGIEPVEVRHEVLSLIYLSLYLWELTEGAFNPAIGPIANLWDINGNNPRVPSEQEIEKTLSLININLKNEFEFNINNNSFYLKHPGMMLDLGAIAKGYAADEAGKIIIEAGIKRAVIDLGGNIVVIGKNENNRPWRVGIQDPNGERGEYIEVVEAMAEETPMSIVTSGVYERFFEADGKRYHHIFSPVTGYPADNELLSVTVIAQSSAMADALSTAVFVKGYEKGLEMLDSFAKNNFFNSEAVFVFKDGSIIRSAD